jgi:hypothetical protein
MAIARSVVHMKIYFSYSEALCTLGAQSFQAGLSPLKDIEISVKIIHLPNFLTEKMQTLPTTSPVDQRG